MGIIIGIDVGISTTKIVGLKEGKPTAPIRITAADPITSLYGAFGKYLHDNNINLNDVEHVMLTGVGTGYVKNDVYGVKTSRCDEFIADALGARYESHIDHAIVVSMGTGTSFVMCQGDNIRHIGGIGIGGGTLQGLSRLMLNTSDIKTVSALAMQGDISHINLSIGDISAQPLPGLPMEATASIFARAQNDASREDIACGIISLVMQSIGSVMVSGINAIIAMAQVGEEIVSAYINAFGAYFKLQSFVFMPVFGLTQGTSPIIGYNYGARNKKRMYSALKIGIIIALVIMAVGVTLMWLMPDRLLSLFGSEESFKNVSAEELMDVGQWAFRIVSLCFLPAAAGILFTTLFQAVGKGVRSMMMSICRQLLLLLPIAALLTFTLGVRYVWFAFPIAELGSLALAIAFFINLVKGDFKRLDAPAGLESKQ